MLSGRSAGSGRRALRTPPSITKWVTCMPLGPSSRAVLCARPRKANLPMAKAAESGYPFTLALAPVSNIAPPSVRYHPPSSLLNGKEPAKGRDLDCFSHGFWVELGDRTVRAGAGVVEDDIGFAEPRIGIVEQARDRRRV